MSNCCCLCSSWTRVCIAIAATAVVGTLIAAALPSTADITAPPAKTADKPTTPTTPTAPSVPAAKPADTPAAKAADSFTGDPYPLAVCVVAGEKLDDKAVVLVHEGRQLKFCCNTCVATFKAKPAKYLAELDKKIVATQKPFYPLKNCVVMPDDELVEGDAVEFVWNNRLMRFCCNGCTKKFVKSPDEYIKKLDEAVIAAQMPLYKLESCPVSGEKLGGMGEPVNLVVNNRLVRVCCKGCAAAVSKDPAAVFAKIDAAK